MTKILNQYYLSIIMYYIYRFLGNVKTTCLLVITICTLAIYVNSVRPPTSDIIPTTLIKNSNSILEEDVQSNALMVLKVLKSLASTKPQDLSIDHIEYAASQNTVNIKIESKYAYSIYQYLNTIISPETNLDIKTIVTKNKVSPDIESIFVDKVEGVDEVVETKLPFVFSYLNLRGEGAKIKRNSLGSHNNKVSKDFQKYQSDVQLIVIE